jgi:hypothetical protein
MKQKSPELLFYVHISQLVSSWKHYPLWTHLLKTVNQAFQFWNIHGSAFNKKTNLSRQNGFVSWQYTFSHQTFGKINSGTKWKKNNNQSWNIIMSDLVLLTCRFPKPEHPIESVWFWITLKTFKNVTTELKGLSYNDLLAMFLRTYYGGRQVPGRWPHSPNAGNVFIFKKSDYLLSYDRFKNIQYTGTSTIWVLSRVSFSS